MTGKYRVVMLVALLYGIWVYVLKPQLNLADLQANQDIAVAENTMSYRATASTDDASELQLLAREANFNADAASFRITELANYAGEFRILGREDYSMGREAEFSPVDFAVGWGKMAEPQIYQQIQIQQSNRWYYWRTDSVPPISIQEIEASSANIHIVPANAAIAQQLQKVRKQDMVYLKGALLEIEAKDGWLWRSSLRRDDTGDGACELMRVDEIRFL